MKIYTKKGDSGNTSLLGGQRVPKDHIRIESYGTIDELNSQLGVVINLFEPAAAELKTIQDRLFTLGSHLANGENSKFKLSPIQESWILELEKSIDQMTEQLSPLRNFVLPGSDLANAHCHVARCICRRAERLCVALDGETKIDHTIVPYLNRLSDYLFTLSRYISLKNNSEEVLWES